MMQLSGEVKRVLIQYAGLLVGLIILLAIFGGVIMSGVDEESSLEQALDAAGSMRGTAWFFLFLSVIGGAVLAFRATSAMEKALAAAKTDLSKAQSTDTTSSVVTDDKKVAEIREALEKLAKQVDVSAGNKTDYSTLLESINHIKSVIYSGLDAFDKLASNTHGTSAAAMQLVASSSEVTDHIQQMSDATEETSSNIEEMTFTIKEVARNIDELSALSEETAAAMNQMDASIRQVENNAVETAKLSEEVNKDADHGVDAISRTIAGINKIKETSESSTEAIKSLESKIEEIGDILSVIDEVAEQTNLLALNAAIIAAQAGEHGRGFAVVANEIKDLAERTGNSTKEIAALIKGVQDETKHAVGVIEQGTVHVEQGVALSYEADNALRKILESVGHSMIMIKGIAQATVEQTQSSKQVAEAITKIAQNVQQISMATNEQAHGSEQLVQAANKMRLISEHVERSSTEQGKACQDINNALLEMNQVISGVAEYSKSSRGNFDNFQASVGKFMNNINETRRNNLIKIKQLVSDSIAKTK